MSDDVRAYLVNFLKRRQVNLRRIEAAGFKMLVGEPGLIERALMELEKPRPCAHPLQDDVENCEFCGAPIATVEVD